MCGVQLPAATRRFSFWLIVAIAGNVLVWLSVLHHRASFNPEVLLELAGVAFFGLLLAITLLYALVRRIRRGPPIGLCAVCGYDLRASPDRCPECGTARTGTTGPSRRG